MSQPLLMGNGSSGQGVPLAAQNSIESEALAAHNGPNSVNGDLVANSAKQTDAKQQTGSQQ